MGNVLWNLHFCCIFEFLALLLLGIQLITLLLLVALGSMSDSQVPFMCCYLKRRYHMIHTFLTGWQGERTQKLVNQNFTEDNGENKNSAPRNENIKGPVQHTVT